MKRILFLLFLAGAWWGPAQAQNKVQCTAPVVVTSANVSICNGSSTTLGASVSSGNPPYTYQWTPSGSLTNANISDPVANPSVTTTYTVFVDDLSGGTCRDTGFVTVTIKTPTVNIAGTNTICTGQTTTLTASGGVSYLWNPSSATTTAISVSPTTNTGYTVTATDAGSCTGTKSYTVTVLTTPTISVSGTNTVCNGLGTSLSASGGSTYVWSPSGSLDNPNISNPVASPTTGTTYTVVGTAANTCTASATYSVSVSSTPTVNVSGTNTLCSGGSVQLNGLGGAGYVWSPGGSLNNPSISNPVATPTGSTNYTLVATAANSCTASATYSVTVFANPTVTITGSSTICNGAGSITLTGNNASTYVWNPGSIPGGTLVAAPTSSGTYTVTGTDGNGCTGTASQSYTVFPQPTANAGADVSVCAGDNTTLTALGNGTYLWSPATGLSCTTCANPVSTPTAPITYTLTVTNNCGSASDDVSISYPALPSANAGPDVTICPGSSTTLVGSGSGTISWGPGGSLSCTVCVNPVASPSVTTVYTFSVTGSCGTNTDQVTVTMATPSASVTGNTTVCSGQPSTLTASGGTNYVWSNGQSTNPIVVSPTTNTSYTVTSYDGNGCTASDVITINPTALPTANAGSDVSICSGSNTTLTATGTGTYLWTPATGLSCTTCANPTANPTVSTTYTVTITDVCGSATDSVLVSLNATPSVNAGADVTICAGSSTSLNASGSGTYSWSPTAGLSCITCANPVATPTGTTDYTVTITDVCGTATDIVNVDVSPIPTATIAGTSTICSGTSSTLSATGGGTYVWTGGSTNDSLIVNPTITTGYNVTVTNGAGCSGTGTFSVTVNTVSVTIAGTSSSVCTGQSSTLTASGGNSYVWNTGSTATSIVVTPTGLTNYTVTATGTAGCTDTDIFSVSVTASPTASGTAASTTVCAGSPNSLTASGGTGYVWSPATGLNNPNISNPVSTATSNVTYTVIVSNSGCTDTATVAIAVNSLPTAVLSGAQASICVGACNTLSASGGATYSWAPNTSTATSVVVCPTSNASYTVTATDANGCTDDAIANIAVLPQVVASITGDTIICSGDLLTLTASGGGTYVWNTSATTSAISVPGSAGTYSVVVSNGACSDSASVGVTVNTGPSANASANPYTINIGATTTLSATTSTGTYTWTPTTGLSCDTCMNPAANPTVTTIYVVTTVDVNGCTSSDTVIVNVTMECEDVFIPTAFSPNGDGFNDYLYVRNPCVKTMEFRVFNRWGQKVFSTTDITQGWDGMFHGKPCDPAVFFWTLNVDFITGTSKYLDGNVTLVR